MRGAWLRLLCRLAELEECSDHNDTNAAATAAAIRAVMPVLAVFHGRLGAPRSLGSVTGAAVARFLPRGFQCVLRAVVAPLATVCTVQHLAVSPDGAVLYRSLWAHHVVEARRVDNGALLHEAALNRVRRPEQLAVTRDGCVLVAEFSNDRIQIMTPQLRLVSYLGAGVLHGPAGVCAVYERDGGGLIIVAGERRGRMVAFRRDGRVLHSWSVSSDRVTCVVALPVVQQEWGVAVASRRGNIHMFLVDGTFVRSVAIADGPCSDTRGSSTDAMAYDADAEELLVVTGAVFAVVDSAGEVRKFPQRLWALGIAACQGTVYTCTFHTPALIALK